MYRYVHPFASACSELQEEDFVEAFTQVTNGLMPEDELRYCFVFCTIRAKGSSLIRPLLCGLQYTRGMFPSFPALCRMN